MSVNGLTMETSGQLNFKDNLYSIDGQSTTETSYGIRLLFAYSSCLTMTTSSSLNMQNNTIVTGSFSSSVGALVLYGVYFRICQPLFSNNASIHLKGNAFSLEGTTSDGGISLTWIASDTSLVNIKSQSSWND